MTDAVSGEPGRSALDPLSDDVPPTLSASTLSSTATPAASSSAWASAPPAQGTSPVVSGPPATGSAAVPPVTSAPPATGFGAPETPATDEPWHAATLPGRLAPRDSVDGFAVGGHTGRYDAAAKYDSAAKYEGLGNYDAPAKYDAPAEYEEPTALAPVVVGRNAVANRADQIGEVVERAGDALERAGGAARDAAERAVDATRDAAGRVVTRIRNNATLPAARGSTTIANEVVEKIAHIAAREVPGVYDLGGDVVRALSAVKEKLHLGEESKSQGISVKLEGKNAEIEVTLVIEYGFQVFSVTEKVREKVISAVENLLGLDVTQVDITVDDVHVDDEDLRGGDDASRAAGYTAETKAIVVGGV